MKLRNCVLWMMTEITNPCAMALALLRQSRRAKIEATPGESVCKVRQFSALNILVNFLNFYSSNWAEKFQTTLT